MAEKRQEEADFYANIEDPQRVINMLEIYLKTAREQGDRVIDLDVYCILGNAYHRVGDFQKAIEYHELHLKKSTEVGDKAKEGRAYGELGNAYDSLGNFHKAIEYHEQHLKISREVGDRAGEGIAYGYLGNAYQGLGDFQKARVPRSSFGSRDFPYLKFGIRDFKENSGARSRLKLCAGGRIPKITLGITGLHEISGRNYGIEEPSWGTSFVTSSALSARKLAVHLVSFLMRSEQII